MSTILENLTVKESYKIKIYSFSNGEFGKVNKHIEFPAFITDFTDSFKSDWKKESLYGKMDPVATYKNTTRTITLAFDIPSENAIEANLHMTRINFLIRGMYPVYSNGTLGTRVISSPPMFRVKFANLIQNINKNAQGDKLNNGLLCYIPSFDFKPKIDSGFYATDTQLVPKLISVNLSLEVIHEHPLGNVNVNGDLRPRVGFFNFPHNFQSKDDVKTADSPAVPPPLASAPAPAPASAPAADSSTTSAGPLLPQPQGTSSEAYENVLYQSLISGTSAGVILNDSSGGSSATAASSEASPEKEKDEKEIIAQRLRVKAEQLRKANALRIQQEKKERAKAAAALVARAVAPAKAIVDKQRQEENAKVLKDLNTRGF